MALEGHKYLRISCRRRECVGRTAKAELGCGNDSVQDRGSRFCTGVEAFGHGSGGPGALLIMLIQFGSINSRQLTLKKKVTIQLPIFSAKSKIGFLIYRLGILTILYHHLRADLILAELRKNRLSARSFAEKMGS